MIGSSEARFAVEYFDGTVTRKRYLELEQKVGDRFAFIGTFDFRKNASNKVPAVLSVANYDETGSTVGGQGRNPRRCGGLHSGTDLLASPCRRARRRRPAALADKVRRLISKRSRKRLQAS